MAPSLIFSSSENGFHSSGIQTAPNATLPRSGGATSIHPPESTILSGFGVAAPRPVIALPIRNDPFGPAWSTPFLGSGHDDVRMEHPEHPSPLQWSREDLRSIVDNDEDYDSSEYGACSLFTAEVQHR